MIDLVLVISSLTFIGAITWLLIDDETPNWLKILCLIIGTFGLVASWV